MSPKEVKADFRKGIYRRIYSGFIWGKRINSVSIQAEAWFWRILVVADDLGNAPADEARLMAMTSGLRQCKHEDVSGWCRELVDAKLMYEYTVDGERFFHMYDFEELQPSARNGRRIQKYPEHTTNETVRLVHPGESGCILGNPGESGGVLPSEVQVQVQVQKQEQEHSDSRAAAAVVSGETIKSRTEKLRRPDWLPEGKPWIDPDTLSRLVIMPGWDDSTVGRVLRVARDGRKTLQNPAGFVVARLEKHGAS